MELSRRHAVAGVLALGAASLIGSAEANPADEAAVKQAVETLRMAQLKQDKAKLEALSASQVSYGHSDGRVEDKAQFIDGVMTRKAIVKSIDFPDLKTAIVGDVAVVRHLYVSESEVDGKPRSTKIGALQVWQKGGEGWKLLARQGFRLPAPA